MYGKMTRPPHIHTYNVFHTSSPFSMTNRWSPCSPFAYRNTAYTVTQSTSQTCFGAAAVKKQSISISIKDDAIEFSPLRHLRRHRRTSRPTSPTKTRMKMTGRRRAGIRRAPAAWWTAPTRPRRTPETPADQPQNSPSRGPSAPLPQFHKKIIYMWIWVHGLHKIRTVNMATTEEIVTHKVTDQRIHTCTNQSCKHVYIRAYVHAYLYLYPYIHTTTNTIVRAVSIQE
jgi:hypothetical protein